VLAITLGLVSASQRGKWADKVIDAFASVGIAVPTFWFAMILIYFFGYKWRVFPFIGMYTLGKEGDVLDFLSHFALPYVTLTMAFLPELIRFIRASAIVEVEKDYVIVQEAFKAKRFEIFGKHVARNVLIPVVTQVGMA
ncbi:ABC transporter permease, partial [Klebsiella pneumoniae]|uniref:ABC transporter permease subunit n=1 Tax=Klebsiella pneumoniae TaxID=573 RepID=UPI00191A5BE9